MSHFQSASGVKILDINLVQPIEGKNHFRIWGDGYAAILVFACGPFWRGSCQWSWLSLPPGCSVARASWHARKWLLSGKFSLLSSHGASCHQGKGSHFWLTGPQPSVSTSEESSLVIMNIKSPCAPRFVSSLDMVVTSPKHPQQLEPEREQLT